MIPAILVGSTGELEVSLETTLEVKAELEMENEMEWKFLKDSLEWFRKRVYLEKLTKFLLRGLKLKISWKREQKILFTEIDSKTFDHF